MWLPATTYKEKQMETKVRHLTQRELADRWNKSEATIERYRSDGVGPMYLKIGGKVMYRIEDIEQFERACLYFSPAEAAYEGSVRFPKPQSNPGSHGVNTNPNPLSIFHESDAQCTADFFFGHHR
jgi:hypothetical protein